MWKQLSNWNNVHNLNMNEYNLAGTFFPLYFVMQSRLKALSVKQLKEVIGYEGVNTRIRDQREVRENIAEDGKTKKGSGESQNKEEWGRDEDEMDMTETTDNSKEHSKYVGGFLRIRYFKK